jgi:hypothetical protein
MFYVLSHYVILNSPPKTRTIQPIQSNKSNKSNQQMGGLKKTRSPIESYRASGFGFEKPV